MADETKRPARSRSTRAAPKAPARSSKAAEAPVASETPVETTEAAPKVEAAPAPATHSSPAPDRAASAGSGNGGVAMAGLFAGVIGIVLALTYPQWTPIVYGSTGSSNRVTADQVRSELKGEIAALKSTVSAMTEQQVALEQAIRIAKLPGILMVAEDLRVALADFKPYAGPLNLFRALTGGDEAAGRIIASIEARAEVGVPSISDLQDRFDDAAHAILTAEQRPQAQGDLASQVSETMASLTAATMRLRWRLDGAPTGDGVPAVVARAEQSVGKGEFQTAIDTLSVLPADRAALAASWIELVRARLAAETVREELDSYIIVTASRIQ